MNNSKSLNQSSTARKILLRHGLRTMLHNSNQTKSINASNRQVRHQVQLQLRLGRPLLRHYRRQRVLPRARLRGCGRRRGVPGELLGRWFEPHLLLRRRPLQRRLCGVRFQALRKRYGSGQRSNVRGLPLLAGRPLAGRSRPNRRAPERSWQLPTW